MVKIRDPQRADEARWRVLWAGYNAFYETELPEEVTAFTWQRLNERGSHMFARVAELDGEVIGLAHAVVHDCTWTMSPVCYLEDLFVDPNVRGTGAGRALIEDLIAICKASGWARLYWHTREGNVTARRLYDRVTAVDDFVHYNVNIA